VKKIVFFLLLSFFICFGCSESTNDKNDIDETKDVTEAEVADEVIDDEADDTDNDDNDEDEAGGYEFSADRVYDDVAWLAHDDRKGRLPGTKGNDDAVEYVLKMFEDLELSAVGDNDTFLQLFRFDIWKLNDIPKASVGETQLESGSGFQVFQYSGKGNVGAEIVFAGYGMTVPPFDPVEYPDCILPPEGYDDFSDLDLDGKIALVIRRGPKGLVSVHNKCPANDVCLGTPCLWNFGYKSKNAALNGAVGVIIMNSYNESGAMPSGMTLGKEYFAENLPVIFVSTEEIEKVIPDIKQWAQNIDDTFTPQSKQTELSAQINVDAGIAEISSNNVIGVLPGNDPDLADEIIVVGAHVDHIGTDADTGEINNGADDNASGTAVMMELARAFVLGEHETARTIVFAAWNAEELGLIGSCHYVETPLLPISKTVAAYSIDMVGAAGGYGLVMYGGNLSDNEWLAEVMSGYAQELDLNYEVAPSNPLDASDHVCFYYEGVPAVLLSTIGAHEYYHTPQDTIETIRKEDLEAAFHLSWAGIYPIAMGIEDRYIGSEIIYPYHLMNSTKPVEARRKNVSGVIY
jgi:aminopeptidase YwaD